MTRKGRKYAQFISWCENVEWIDIDDLYQLSLRNTIRPKYFDKFLIFIIFSTGWNPWGDWTSCSSSCGGGKQERRRTCNSKPGHMHHHTSTSKPCPSYNIEQRMCNSFDCKGKHLYPYHKWNKSCIDVFLLRKIQFQFNFNSCYLKNISILCYQNFHTIRYRTFWSIKNWNSSNSLNVKFVEMQTLSSDCTKMQRKHETSKVCQVVKIHVIKLSKFDRNSYLSFSDSNLIKIPSCNSIM